jgi:ketosteroid isomerase-like protein
MRRRQKSTMLKRSCLYGPRTECCCNRDRSRLQGIAAIRQLLEQQKQQSAAIQTLSYLENWQERRVLGDDAYEWGNMSITAKLPDGKEMTQTVYAIRILRRQPDGSWKVARAIITPGPRKN